MPATPGDGHQQADTGELKAGQEGGDEQHEQTDEERMLEEIAQQKELLDAMPGDSHSDICTKAPHAKQLGQLVFKYQLTTEKKRLTSVMAKFEEEHGALYSEPCLICLEDIHVHASKNLTECFACCGGFICKLCAARNRNGPEIGFDKCPLCRESIVNTTASGNAEKLLALAKRGVAWAQTDLGKRLCLGIDEFKKEEKAGLEWINKAAAQNYSSALHSLAILYDGGMGSVLRKSEEKAKELMIKSANLGYGLANSWLAESSYFGIRGFDRDQEEAYFRASVAHTINESDGKAATLLGLWHYGGTTIPEPSPYLACYYQNIAANSGQDDGSACLLYSQALRKLSEFLHDGRVAIPGSNVLPAMFFWLRKSRDLGYRDEREQLKNCEIVGQSYCDNCSKKAQAGEKFKQCSMCKAGWYCSKECQVEAWRAGHKKDCKRAKMLKFEDYLNAE